MLLKLNAVVRAWMQASCIGEPCICCEADTLCNRSLLRPQSFKQHFKTVSPLNSLQVAATEAQNLDGLKFGEADTMSSIRLVNRRVNGEPCGEESSLISCTYSTLGMFKAP